MKSGHAGPAATSSRAIEVLDVTGYTDQSVGRQDIIPSQAIEGKNGPDDEAAAARQILQEPRPPSAIIFGNDLMAIGAMTAVVESGLSVPKDVSIVGADDSLFSRYSNPSLTTTRIPRDALGSMAVEALGRMPRTKRCIGIELVVYTQLIVRSSTAPPKDSTV